MMITFCLGKVTSMVIHLPNLFRTLRAPLRPTSQEGVTPAMFVDSDSPMCLVYSRLLMVNSYTYCWWFYPYISSFCLQLFKEMRGNRCRYRMYENVVVSWNGGYPHIIHFKPSFLGYPKPSYHLPWNLCWGCFVNWTGADRTRPSHILAR